MRSTLIVVHAHYADSLGGILGLIDGADSRFHVLICATSQSVAARSNALAVEAGLESFEVLTGKNRGRNFGIWLAEYGAKTLEFDYVVHVHTKKSMDSGIDLSAWARHLQVSVLGSLGQHIRYLDENDDVNIISPRNIHMPAWAYSTLKNQPQNEHPAAPTALKANQFAAYPMGSMFIARSEYLAPLFEYKYSYEDFPAEPIPRDGSVLHAMERWLGNLDDSSDYGHLRFFDAGTGEYIDFFSELLARYQSDGRWLEDWLVSNCKTVSFDIFDTLVTRAGNDPDEAKRRLGSELNELGFTTLSANEFVDLRNRCEAKLRRRLPEGSDVKIESVYDELLNTTAISEATAERLSWREFELDLELLRPRNVVLQLVNNLISRDQRVLFTSDMYYSYAMISSLLASIGLGAPQKIYVSSDTGLRKDNGTIWPHLKKLYPYVIHLGDNTVSDVQIPGDYQIKAVHIVSESQYAKILELRGLPGDLAVAIAADQLHYS